MHIIIYYMSDEKLSHYSVCDMTNWGVGGYGKGGASVEAGYHALGPYCLNHSINLATYVHISGCMQTSYGFSTVCNSH